MATPLELINLREAGPGAPRSFCREMILIWAAMAILTGAALASGVVLARKGNLTAGGVLLGVGVLAIVWTAAYSRRLHVEFCAETSGFRPADPL